MKGREDPPPATEHGEEAPAVGLATQPQVSPLVNSNDNDKEHDSMSSWRQDYFLPDTPDVIPLEAGQRLVAMGDVHGNYAHLLVCLAVSGIIGSVDDNNWIAGNTICVQIGDVLDRGYQEEKCILLLTKLARQAKDAGGAQIILWGNHEFSNATGFFWDSNDNELEKRFIPFLDHRDDKWREKYGTNMPARLAAFEPGGLLAEPFLSKLKVAVQVGRTVLVHGGLTKEHLDRHGGIVGLNRMCQDWILNKFEVPDIPTNKAPDAVETRMHGLLHNNSSPTLMREYSSPPNKEPRNIEEVSAKVCDVLKELNADRIVVGHTAQVSINSVIDGKVWRIDTGSYPCQALQVVRTCKDHNKEEEEEEEVSILKDDYEILRTVPELHEIFEPKRFLKHLKSKTNNGS